MNTTTFEHRAAKRVDGDFEQTVQLHQPMRVRVLKRNKPVRITALDWALWFATAITVAALVYKCAGPA